jgi:hypothetical protein
MRQFAKQKNFNPIDRASVLSYEWRNNIFARIREKQGCLYYNVKENSGDSNHVIYRFLMSTLSQTVQKLNTFSF